MTPIQIQSRLIKSVFFSQEDGQLRLCLCNGEERRFTGVTMDAVVALVKAPSPGTHYVEKFRHQYRRVG